MQIKDITVPIRTQLWRDKNSEGNFEDTVQHFRSLAQQGDASHYNLLISILAGMFNAMKNGFVSMGFKFEFQLSDMNMNVAVFLQRFEAIFTLNQDTLMEAHYLNDDIAGLARASGTAGRYQDWKSRPALLREWLPWNGR